MAEATLVPCSRLETNAGRVSEGWCVGVVLSCDGKRKDMRVIGRNYVCAVCDIHVCVTDTCCIGRKPDGGPPHDELATHDWHLRSNGTHEGHMMLKCHGPDRTDRMLSQDLRPTSWIPTCSRYARCTKV